jgi:hypothetical protein
MPRQIGRSSGAQGRGQPSATERPAGHGHQPQVPFPMEAGQLLEREVAMIGGSLPRLNMQDRMDLRAQLHRP